MLDVSVETVCLLIGKLHEFHGKEEVDIPRAPDNPGDDLALQVLANHTDDLLYQELKSAIDDLEPDQQVCLVALMWLGRDDYSVDEWPTVLQEAQDNWNERTAEYLIATPLVADYLEEGLSLLGYSCQ